MFNILEGVVDLTFVLHIFTMKYFKGVNKLEQGWVDNTYNT